MTTDFGALLARNAPQEFCPALHAKLLDPVACVAAEEELRAFTRHLLYGRRLAPATRELWLRWLACGVSPDPFLAERKANRCERSAARPGARRFRLFVLFENTTRLTTSVRAPRRVCVRVGALQSLWFVWSSLAGQRNSVSGRRNVVLCVARAVSSGEIFPWCFFSSA